MLVRDDAVSLPTAVAALGDHVFVTDLVRASVVRLCPKTGRTSIVTGSVGSGPILETPFDITFDESGALLVLDLGLHAVLRVEIATGARRIVADLRDLRLGVAVQTPLGLVAERGDQFLVLDRGENRIVRVNGQGERTTLVDDDSAAVMKSPLSLTRLRDGFVAVADPDAKAVFRICPSTGSCEAITSSEPGRVRGAGPHLSEPVAVVEQPDGTLWVGDLGREAVMVVHPDTGDRGLLDGPVIEHLWSMCIDGSGRVYYVDRARGAVVMLSTGFPSEARGARVPVTLGPPPSLLQPYDLVSEPSTGIVRVMERGRGVLVDFAVASGVVEYETKLAKHSSPTVTEGRGFGLARLPGGWAWTDYVNRCVWYQGDGTAATIVSGGGEAGDTVGDGVGFQVPAGLASAGDTLFVVDAAARAIIVVDRWTGARRVVTRNGDGRGPEFARIMHVRVGPGGRLYGGDMGRSAVFEIDPETGNRTILSDGCTGRGPALRKPLGLAIDGSVLYVADFARNAILAIDCDQGTRTVVSDNHRSQGPAFTMPVAVDVYDDDRLIVADFTLAAVLWVDRRTGTRAFSTRSVGEGRPTGALSTRSVVASQMQPDADG